MESFSLLVFIAGIALLGFLAQWISWGIGVPSIVFLFGGGLLVGPLTGMLSPDALFGDLLFPVVSALIGIILFEGGLTLDFDDIGDIRGVVFRIIIVGGFITFGLTTLLAYTILGFRIDVAFLLGGILVVTGPTVVIPLLHQIRPEGEVGSVARWEGIIIDPIGAILAVIIYELIFAEVSVAGGEFGVGLMKFGLAMFIGTLIGLAVGYLLVFLFDRYWIPDYLHNFSIIAFVLTAQALANHLAHESGLLAVTIMGMYLANQNQVTIRHIMNFKEELRVIFISVLFLILVARLDVELISAIHLREILFLGALVVLVRPCAVLLSTIGSSLSWSERTFLSWLAPRGIVAAAVSSLFAIKLQEFGIPGATQLVHDTFFVIAGTVVIYGLTLQPLSRFLGLSEQSPQGLLLIGAHQWARALAHVLRQEGVRVRLIDKNRNRVLRGRNSGLDVECIDIISEQKFLSADVQGIGYCLALTPNDEVNTLAVLHAQDMGFDRSQVFQLPSKQEKSEDGQSTDSLQGRPLFGKSETYDSFKEKFDSGWTFEIVQFESEEEIDSFRKIEKDEVIPVIRLGSEGMVDVLTMNTALKLQPGDRLVIIRSDNVDLEGMKRS